MAEFQEVMKQFKRMCEHADSGCSGCAFQGSDCSMSALVNNIEEAESLIMQWAAEHPEPVYPTWFEWLDSLGLIKSFSNEDGVAFQFDWDKRIPADIAQKLGLEPNG